MHTKSQKVDFFISRNKADSAWAQWIAWQLEDAGYTTILQDWDFGAGGNFALRMHDAIARSNRTIAVLSPDFLSSEFTAPEWAAAFAEDPIGLNQKIIPIKVRSCSPVGLLRALVWIDLVGLEEGVAKGELLTGVKIGRAKPKTAPPFPGNHQPSKPPFPGSAKDAAAPPRALTTPSPKTSRRKSSSARVALTQKEAAERFERNRWGAAEGSRFGGTSSTQLAAVLVPGNQGQAYIEVLKLGDAALQKRLRDLALVGSGTVLRAEHGTQTAEARDHLSFVQRDDGLGREIGSVLEIYTDGTLIYRLALNEHASQLPAFGRSVAEGYVIDEQQVRNAMASFLRFANAFYRLQGIDPGTVHLGASLNNITNKYFGVPPSTTLASFTFAGHRLENPLRVPDLPLAITADQRRSPNVVAKTIADHFARRFRLERSYYPS